MMHIKQEPLDGTSSDDGYTDQSIQQTSTQGDSTMMEVFEIPVKYELQDIKQEIDYSDQPLELIVRNNCRKNSRNEKSEGCNNEMKYAEKLVIKKELDETNEIQVPSPRNTSIDNLNDLPVSLTNAEITGKVSVANLSGKKLYNFPRKKKPYKRRRPNKDLLQYSYVCDLCNHVSKRLSDLKSHKLTHIEDNPYICEECGYACRKLSNLKSHKQTHRGIKPYTCDQCEYSSKFINNLKTHKIIHSDDKPFHCTMCPYTCGRPSNLKRHMLKHSEVRTFACNECSYMSKDITGLKVHKLVHTGKKPHVCDVCKSSYVTVKSLNHHKKKHLMSKLEDSIKT